VLATAVVLAASSCATGTDAVAQGGSFDFVSPGGQTEIFYDPPEIRGTIGALAGPNLMEEGQRVSLDDYVGKVVVINLWGQWCGTVLASQAPAGQPFSSLALPSQPAGVYDLKLGKQSAGQGKEGSRSKAAQAWQQARRAVGRDQQAMRRGTVAGTAGKHLRGPSCKAT